MKNDDGEDEDMKKRMSVKKNGFFLINIIFLIILFYIKYLAFLFIF